MDKDSLRALVSPTGIQRALRLLEMGEIHTVEDLKILRDRAQEIEDSGVINPLLTLFKDKIISMLYSKVVLDEK